MTSKPGLDADSGHGAAAQVIVLEMQHEFIKNYNYLVVDRASRKAVIVDPAWQMEKITAAVDEAGVRLSGVLITHSHPDHIHLARTVAVAYACPIWMSRQEIAFSGFAARELIGIGTAAWAVGGMRICPVPTPGHTPGGVCYVIGDSVFTGDTLFAEGCGSCPDESSAYELFASLGYLKSILGPDTRVFPGHCYGRPPGQPFSRLLQENIYLQFSDKETFAAFRLRKSQRIRNFFGL